MESKETSKRGTVTINILSGHSVVASGKSSWSFQEATFAVELGGLVVRDKDEKVIGRFPYESIATVE